MASRNLPFAKKPGMINSIMIEKNTPEFDKYADKYEFNLNESIPLALSEDNYFSKYKVDYVKRRLGKDIPDKILDFGCGIGLSLSILNSQFQKSDIWGYDLSKKSLDIAKNRVENITLTNDCESLPDNSFDMIFIANVFHHIPVNERGKALLLCKKLLSSRGKIFLFEHNPLNPLTRMIFERCPYDKGASMLLKREILHLAGKSGLSTVRSDYTLFLPKQFSFLRVLESKLGWLPLGAQYCVEMSK